MAEDGQAPKKVIVGVRLLGIQKRYVPNKHYLYILSVKWSEGSEFIIYRRYSAFFQLHQRLSDLFPVESGAVGKKGQQIPPLPKQRWFGMERFKDTDEKMTTIDEFCRKVAMAEPKISEHEEVLSFFKAMQDDLTPPTPDPKKPNKTYLTFESKSNDTNEEEEKPDDLEISAPILLETYRAIVTFTPGGKTELGLEEGAHVDVVEKNMSGWWLVQVKDKQGWCPASHLEPLDQPEERDEGRPNWEGEEFRTTQQYKAQIDDEISFDEGVIVHVIHKLLDGWWIIRYNDKVGYAPSGYLQKYTNPHLAINKVRARTDISFIKKLPPRRSTVQKKTATHNAPSQPDLQLYRRKTLEASKSNLLKGGFKLDGGRKGCSRVSDVMEEKEEEEEGTYVEMKSCHSYVNDDVAEELAGRKASPSGWKSAGKLQKATESRHAYVNEEVLAQGSTGSAHTYVNEESLAQGHGVGKSDRSADDVWAPAFVSPNTAKAAETRNTKSVNTSVWAPAFVNKEKSKKEFPMKSDYLNSDTVASMAGKPKDKNTEFLSLGEMHDTTIRGFADAWTGQRGLMSHNNVSSGSAYENIESSPAPRQRSAPSPKSRRTPVATPRKTTSTSVLPSSREGGRGKSSPKNGRLSPKNGQSRLKGVQARSDIPVRSTVEEIAAKFGPLKAKVFQCK